MIFGLKDLPYEMITLQNDDVETPTRMIGQKMVPILEKEDGSFMPESMDIIHFIDNEFGVRKLTGQGNPKLAEWISQAREYMYALCMPRWVQAPLDEFSTPAARQYFTQKKEAMIGSFSENIARSPELITRAEEHANALAPLIVSKEAASGTLSEDDVHLFAALRALSIVRGIEYPEAVSRYRKRMAEKAGIPLHDGYAL